MGSLIASSLDKINNKANHTTKAISHNAIFKYYCNHRDLNNMNYEFEIKY